MRQVYELCSKEYFDDYVLFWPAAHDAFRRPIAMRHALRGLEQFEARLAAETIAAQARHLTELESLLNQGLAQGVRHAAAASQRMRDAKAGVDARGFRRPVDDDELQRRLLAQLFVQESWELAFAASGAEALGLLHKRLPDLVLLDLDMPGMNGLETLRRLKAVPAFAAMPVIMVTGQSEKGVVVDCLQSGAADFVVKPPDRETLLAKVNRLLGR